MKFTIALFLASVSSVSATPVPTKIPTASPSNKPSKQPSEQPSQQPSQQPSEHPSGQPSEQPSEQPSGQPSEQPSGQPSQQPSQTPSCTPSSAPTASGTVNLFYPDQTSNGFETGCLNDGAQPAWMEANPSTWLFSTLDSCCKQHFSWNYAYCMGTVDDTCARAYWYPDWEGGSNACVRDGDEPFYMTSNPGHYLFTTKQACCDEHYSWHTAECMGGAGSSTSGGKYYPDWTSGDETCKNDGNAPDYMVTNAATWLYLDLGDCCARYFGYKSRKCLGTSGSSSTGSGKFFPDWAGDNEGCLVDGGTTRAPDWMQGSTVYFFADLDSCCKQHYNWNLAGCKGQSATTTATGTSKWYVVWGNPAKCVKDCKTGTDCGGFAEGWDTLYNTQSTCCSTRVSYMYKECMA